VTVDAFVKRLVEAAAARGVQVDCEVGPVDESCGNGASGVTLTAEPNMVTLWAGEGELVWVRASVIPEGRIMRYRTAEMSVPMSDASIALLIDLLEGRARFVLRWRDGGTFLVAGDAPSKLSLPIVGQVIGSVDGKVTREAQRQLTDALIARLTEEAARRGLEFTYAVSSEEGLGFESVARVDVTLGDNTVTIWPENDQVWWCRASVSLASSSRRVDTIAYEFWGLDDEIIRLLVGVVNGEGRIVHRRLLSDVFEVRQGKARLRLPVPGPRTRLERIIAWPDMPRYESSESVEDE